VGWQSEDLSAQVTTGTGITISTTFQRVLSRLAVFYDGLRVKEALFTEVDSIQLRLDFASVLGEDLLVVYWTDQTADGRVVGYSEDPSGGAVEIPQTLEDIIEGLDQRIDAIEDAPPADSKDSVRYATTADVGGSYDQTGGISERGQLASMADSVDGTTLEAGDRILVKNQTAKDQNGVYVVSSVGSGVDGVWDRAGDFDADAEVTSGAVFHVIAGIANARTAWILLTPDPIEVGGASGTDQLWGQIQGGTVSITDLVRTYAAGVLAQDAVYQKADATVGRADATSTTTARAFLGFVASKDLPNPGQVTIRYHGDLSGFSGLVAGKTYLISTSPGQVVASDDITNPIHPEFAGLVPGSGFVTREVGQAKDSTTLFVEGSRDYEVM